MFTQTHVLKRLTGIGLLCLLMVSGAGAEDPPAAVGPSYVDLEPAFTLNYGDSRRIRYIQTAITLRVRDTTELRSERWPWVLKDDRDLLVSERIWWLQVR